MNFRLTNSGNSSLLYPLNYFRLRIGKKYYDSIFAIINQTKSRSENFRSFSVFPLHKKFQEAIIRASKLRLGHLTFRKIFGEVPKIGNFVLLSKFSLMVDYTAKLSRLSRKLALFNMKILNLDILLLVPIVPTG